MTHLEERELARELGLLEAVTIGIGAVIGGAVYSILGIALNLAGPAMLLSFIFCAFTALTVGYNYAKLGRRFPSSGASYAYIAKAFPNFELVKTLIGMTLWFGHLVASGFYSVSFGLYANHLIPFIPAKVFSIILVAVFLSLNLTGVGKTGKTQDLIVFIKVGILILFIAIGTPSINFTFFEEIFPRGIINVFLVSSLLFIGYEGFEIIGTAGEELENPEKNLMRAIYITVIVASLLYIGVGVIAIGLTPYYSLKDSNAPLSELASIAFGRWGSALLGFGALFSTSSALNASLFGSSRLAYAMAREGIMPSFFAKLSKTTKAPYIGLIFSSSIILILALLGVVKSLSALASLIFLIIFFMVSLSNFKLRHITHSTIVYPCLAMILCIYFILFVAITAWIQLLITIIIIIAIYSIKVRMNRL